RRGAVAAMLRARRTQVRRPADHLGSLRRRSHGRAWSRRAGRRPAQCDQRRANQHRLMERIRDALLAAKVSVSVLATATPTSETPTKPAIRAIPSPRSFLFPHAAMNRVWLASPRAVLAND